MEVVLTNLCMIYQNDTILVQNRVKSDWPGLTFPGGHVEENEDHIYSIIREIKEETGLTLEEVEECGFIEWFNQKTFKRELCLIYRSNKFSGELVYSNEGEVFFIKMEDLKKYPFSTDFDKILNICLKGLK
jgi:8-oxo-dGTP diphosphatase